MCMVSASNAQSELEEVPIQDNVAMLREIRDVLRGIQSLLEPSLNESSSQDVNGCKCSGLQCTCCQRIRVRKLKIDKDCCLSVRYLKQNYGFLTTLTLGNRRLFSKEISLRNPIPICIGVPYLTKGASICIQLNNLRAGKGYASGCGTLLGRLLFVTVAKIKLGCFNLRFVDDDVENMGAIEMPYYDSADWIEEQQDQAFPFPPIPPFPITDEEVVMMESIEQPLPQNQNRL